MRKFFIIPNNTLVCLGNMNKLLKMTKIKTKKNTKKKDYTVYPSDTDSLVDCIIGGRIKSFRLAAKMSQARLASVIDVTFQQLQKYEKGTNKISCNKLLKIAEELSVPISKFFEDIDERITPKESNNSYASLSDNIPTLIKESLSEQVKNKFPKVSAITNKETLDLINAFNKIKDKSKRDNILSLIKSMSDD